MNHNYMADTTIPRPFLKWAGGKTQLVEELKARLPDEFNNYHEPFLGGGALFFKLFRENRIRQAYLSDLNSELIDTYLAIRDHVDEVIDELSRYPHETDFYYDLRLKDPDSMDLPLKAARMIYLNKTGFNGLYRVNSKGKFNVPFGRYKNPKYYDKKNLLAVSEALQGVKIGCKPFETVLDNAKSGDFVYFDPPYAPLTSTAYFTSYQANGFSSNDQKRLSDVSRELGIRGVFVLVSNSNAEIIFQLYSPNNFITHEVMATRAINSNGDKRGKLIELIITNYPSNVNK